MAKYAVVLWGTKEVEINYTAVIEVEADNEDAAADMAQKSIAIEWVMDDVSMQCLPSDRMDSFYVNQVDRLN